MNAGSEIIDERAIERATLAAVRAPVWTKGRRLS
jgi:hypothetical protein